MEITKEQVGQILNYIDLGLTNGVRVDIASKVSSLEELFHGFSDSIQTHLRQLTIVLSNTEWSSPQARAEGMRRLAIAQLGTCDTFDEVGFFRNFINVINGKLLPKVLRSAALAQAEPYKSQFLEAAARCEEQRSLSAAQYAACITSGIAPREAGAPIQNEAQWAAIVADHVVGWGINCVDSANKCKLDNCVRSTKLLIEATRWAVEPTGRGTQFDQVLVELVEDVVWILVEMKTPGSEFLYLTEQRS